MFFIVLLTGSFVFQSVSGNKNADYEPARGGKYVEGLVGQPKHINPLLSQANSVDADISRIVFAGLLKFDTELNLQPDLAEAFPETSADGKEYIIRLRENLKWHDGEPLTADDVIFTYQILQNPEIQSPLRLSWNKVSAEKLDDRTVKITTPESSASFPANLTVGILPKHAWESAQTSSFGLSSLNLEPIGSGPFQVSEVKRGSRGEIRSMKLEAFDDYHRGGPYLDEVEFKFYQTTDELIRAYHATDITGLGYVPFDSNLFLEARNKLQQFQLPLPAYQAVFINRVVNPAPLEDVNVRMALAKAVDKQKIIDEVYGGQAEEAYGPILQGHLGYHEQIPGAEMNKHDIEAAKALLEKSGWKLDEETDFRKDDQGRTITLSLATNSNYPPNVETAELLKQMWENIGIQIILNIETIADLEGKYIRSRNYELLLFSENVGADPDPYPFWHSSNLRDPGLNLSTFSNSEADKLLVDARINIAPEERAAKYRKFQEIFVGDVPAVFLTRSVYVYNVSNKVQGLDMGTIITPSERFANIEKWHIETKRVKR